MKKDLLLIIPCVLIVLAIDTLEHYDNWVDRFDPYEYYEAKENLK